MVPGKAFDRIAIIWLENTDYDKAIGDPNLAWLASKGITLSSYHGVTHPSEPNYVANFGGDYFGMNNDDLNKLDANVSCLADLLEAKGISWGEYQEDMPYTGYQGYQYLNKKGANDYVRKHNPAVIYNSVAEKEERLSKIKNTTLFFEDLENDNLPQWMFITPNMTSDGHDSSVTVAGSWTRNFVEPLLNNTKFMKNTLVLITFDENETYTIQNNVLAILLGDAVPAKYIGTTDSTYYDHYSALSTVEANWDLDTLGRFDVGANVFKMVAEKTGDVVREWTATPALENRYFNYSYAGPFNDISGKDDRPYAAPNTDLVYAGRKVFPEVQQTWAKYANLSYYTTALEIPDGYYPPAGFA
ncbi:phosphoesterase-domain-containing protein [Saccharata proteae CBS 121410]|uniref:Phosphoesterase-domain-containing protein n=1 Tax=Saccharata proteae CBS 121410 TaxID=1314787 RepID=A0A6A5YEG9_9PEZI|nr:phosphoesterase-domain-containing protein [Saccharata proteae CBS 121410]